jgi:hypothetical protein
MPAASRLLRMMAFMDLRPSRWQESPAPRTGACSARHERILTTVGARTVALHGRLALGR